MEARSSTARAEARPPAKRTIARNCRWFLATHNEESNDDPSHHVSLHGGLCHWPCRPFGPRCRWSRAWVGHQQHWGCASFLHHRDNGSRLRHSDFADVAGWSGIFAKLAALRMVGQIRSTCCLQLGCRRKWSKIAHALDYAWGRGGSVHSGCSPSCSTAGCDRSPLCFSCRLMSFSHNNKRNAHSKPELFRPV